VSTEQHVSRASDGDQHHPGDTDRLVMKATFVPDAGAQQASSYESRQNIQDLGRHLNPARRVFSLAQTER
jgi:hypothetical protein